MKEHTFHIHIKGRVQGVGFRPIVYRLAQKHHLNGWVCNGVDGVHLEFNADHALASRFCEELRSEAPALSVITELNKKEIPFKSFGRFLIRESSAEATPELQLTPDLGICDACTAEIFSPASRRFQYPFATCTQCGPRYSIVSSLPYDRERTTMNQFAMCEACGSEYEDIADRRYYSQTNSCPDCAIHLWLTSADGERHSFLLPEVVKRTSALLLDGKIIAVKGIGGYLLMCDAGHAEAISRLRERKRRPTKPFALMYPSPRHVEEDCLLSNEEKKAFTSIEAPIVLLRLKEERTHALPFHSIAPGLSRIGVMHPYTPLFQLLLKDFDRPVIATSGNLSGSPIYYTNDEAFENLKQYADCFLMNDRAIVVPQDDSVIQFTHLSGQKILLRRSRGLAPSLIHRAWKDFNEEIFCAGADLKSAFTLLHAGNTYVSQFLGDLANFDSQRSYRKVLDHLTAMLHMNPALVIRDLHPHYHSSMIAQEYATRMSVPVLSIQHHEAHFAAVLAENELIHSREKMLGVIWDGVGFGSDGSIRGGEFFHFADGKILHAASIEPFSYVHGDKMSREPRLSALSIAGEIPGAASILRSLFNDREWNFYQKSLMIETHPASSSMGRVFDSVSALLGIKSINTFEGEAAMHLEQLAAAAANQSWRPFELQQTGTFCLPVRELISRIVEELQRKTPGEIIAIRFHQTLVEAIERFARSNNVKSVAFSGGVFQNALLVEMIISKMQDHYSLHFHRQLSPNDECISFGQLAAYYLRTKTP